MRLGEKLAIGGLKYDVNALLTDWVGHIRELLFHQAGGYRRGHTRNGELVNKVALEGGDGAAEPGEDKHPGDNHRPFMQVGEPADFEQDLCHVELPLHLSCQDLVATSGFCNV